MAEHFCPLCGGSHEIVGGEETPPVEPGDLESELAAHAIDAVRDVALAAVQADAMADMADAVVGVAEAEADAAEAEAEAAADVAEEHSEEVIAEEAESEESSAEEDELGEEEPEPGPEVIRVPPQVREETREPGQAKGRTVSAWQRHRR